MTTSRVPTSLWCPNFKLKHVLKVLYGLQKKEYWLGLAQYTHLVDKVHYTWTVMVAVSCTGRQFEAFIRTNICISAPQWLKTSMVTLYSLVLVKMFKRKLWLKNHSDRRIDFIVLAKTNLRYSTASSTVEMQRQYWKTKILVKFGPTLKQFYDQSKLFTAWHEKNWFIRPFHFVVAWNCFQWSDKPFHWKWGSLLRRNEEKRVWFAKQILWLQRLSLLNLSYRPEIQLFTIHEKSSWSKENAVRFVVFGLLSACIPGRLRSKHSI